jgi:hypothetical protein
MVGEDLLRETQGSVESTGIYWAPIYSVLEEAGFQIVLENPCQVKAIPGRKTDQSDSEWLAYLLRAELINPSYIPERKQYIEIPNQAENTAHIEPVGLQEPRPQDPPSM